MNELRMFEGKEVEVLEIEGKILFNPKHVGECLGIVDSTVRNYLADMDLDEVILLKNSDVLSTDFRKLNNAGEKFITEEGVYTLVFKSRKPEAIKFQKWVTKEVLPSIRNHGIYATDNVIDNILNNPDFGIELLTKLKEERKARIEAERTNAILMHVNKTYTSTELAKEMGLKSAIALNKVLCEKGIQYKQNGTWVLYSKYSTCGYTEIKQKSLDNGRVIYDRHWTQLGRKFILELLHCDSTMLD